MNKIAIFINTIIIGIMTIALALANDIYYVDATHGNDINSGTSIDTPWKTIAKVNNFYFNQGDEILFKRGEAWREELKVPSSGEDDRPITFGAYGSGDRPKILESVSYDAWWQDNLIENSDFEFTSTGIMDDGITDGFAGWTTTLKSYAVSGAHSGNTAVKIVGVAAGIMAAYIYNITPATTYYFEFYAYKTMGSANVQVSIKDDNAVPVRYLQDDGSWSTAANNLDSIEISSIGEWTKYSLIFTTDAISLDLIKISFGHNPNIEFYLDSVYMVQGIEKVSPPFIWTGRVKESSKTSGILRDGKRVPKDDILGAHDGYFYPRLSYFVFRNDNGNPGKLDIGMFRRGIYIVDKNNIIIDNIDIDGASGGYDGIEVAGGSQNVVIRNSEIKNTMHFGISSEKTTANIKFENLDVHDCRSTGIYMNSQGGSVIKCKSHDNGRIISDYGDRGGIGSLEGGNVIISECEAYHNGQDDGGSGVDFEISVVAAVNPVTITKNYVHDCIQGGIQVAAGSNNSVIDYNIVNGFSTTTAGESGSAGSWAGIRVGGGTLGVSGVKIYNNVIHGGGNAADSKNPGSHAGLNVVFDESSGLEVKNNIFSDNAKDIYINYNVGSATSGWDFNSNIFHKSDFANNWYWKGTSYSSLKEWQSKILLDANSLDQNPFFCNNSGNYSTALDFYLQPDSPAIDKGIDVGLTTDFEGNIVPFGSAPDISAFEYNPIIKYDIDADGDVDVLDVQLCVNVVLGIKHDEAIAVRANVNKDGAVDVSDVQMVVNKALGG